MFYVRAANQRGGLGKPTKTVVFRKADTYILTVPHLSGLGEDDDDEEEWKGWSTICLGYNAKVPVSSINEDGTEGTGNITVYGTGTPSDNNKVLEGNVLHLKKVNYMVANCGYIVSVRFL